MPTIIRARLSVAKLPLLVPFGHAAMTRRSNTTVFVVLESSDGALGIGEALPRRYVTGEEPEDVVATLRAPLERLVGTSVGEAWDLLPTLCVPLMPVIGGLGACCALELACLDLLSRTAKTSADQILKLPASSHAPPPVTATVPLLPPWLMKLVIRSFEWAGARDFKIKLKGDLTHDEKLLDHVSKTLQADSDMRVDYNMALSFADGLPYLERIAARYPRLTWIEEPLSATDRHHMPELQRHFDGRFTFCADESVCRESDLTQLIESGAYRAVNIRVGKHGGPSRAASLAHRAHEAGLAVQIGSLVGETAVLSNAGALVARYAPSVRYLEVGLSPMILRSSPVRGAVTPGRGMKLDFEKLPLCGLSTPHQAWQKRTGRIEEIYAAH